MTPSLALHSRDVRLCDADTLAETSESSSGAESAQSATNEKPRWDSGGVLSSQRRGWLYAGGVADSAPVRNTLNAGAHRCI